MQTLRDKIEKMLQNDYKLVLDKDTGEVYNATPLDKYRRKEGNTCFVQDMSSVDWVLLVIHLLSRTQKEGSSSDEIKRLQEKIQRLQEEIQRLEASHEVDIKIIQPYLS